MPQPNSSFFNLSTFIYPQFPNLIHHIFYLFLKKKFTIL